MTHLLRWFPQKEKNVVLHGYATNYQRDSEGKSWCLIILWMEEILHQLVYGLSPQKKKKKKHYLQCFIVTVYGCQLVQDFATIHSMKPSPGRQLPASHPCDSYPWPQQRCWEAPCNVHNSDMNMMIWVVLWWLKSFDDKKNEMFDDFGWFS